MLLVVVRPILVHQSSDSCIPILSMWYETLGSRVCSKSRSYVASWRSRASRLSPSESLRQQGLSFQAATPIACSCSITGDKLSKTWTEDTEHPVTQFSKADETTQENIFLVMICYCTAWDVEPGDLSFLDGTLEKAEVVGLLTEIFPVQCLREFYGENMDEIPETDLIPEMSPINVPIRRVALSIANWWCD